MSAAEGFAPTDSGSRVRLRDGLPFCVGVFLIARIAISLLGVGVVRETPPLRGEGFPDAGIDRPVEAGWHNAFEGTYRWDAGWFIRITELGYAPDDGSAEFFPAFPSASRLIATISPLGPIGASILVANLAFLASLIVLFALTTIEFTQATARRTVVLLASYPPAFIFTSPYSESLFLLATVTAFYQARRGRWARSALAGIVAAATRAAGVLVVPSLLTEAFATGERENRSRRLLLAVSPVIGTLVYLGYWHLAAGDFLLPLRAPALWGRTTRFPLSTLGEGIVLGVVGPTRPDGWLLTMDLLLSAFILVPLIIGKNLLRPTYLVYAAMNVLVILTVAYEPRPLVGAPRYVAVLFPAFWILAAKLRQPHFVATVALFTLGQLVLAALFMSQRIFVF